MKTQRFSLSATAKRQPPVCIGDISAYDFSVSVRETTTSFVAKKLRDNPKIPGVLLYDEENFEGMIPRQILFERLGRLYGVDLFLNKMIRVLYQELHISAPLILPGEMRVDDAVQRALAREDARLYHPIVVFYAGKYRLLDMQSLIMVQASMLENLNSVAMKLNKCSAIVEDNMEDVGIEKIMDALREVVPFHDAMIFTHHKINHPFYLKGESFIHPIQPEDKKFSFHQLPKAFNQIICVDDEHGVLFRKDVDGLLKKDWKAWMGIPLSDGKQNFGALSLYRYAHTPFSANEKELAENYAWYLGMIIGGLLTGSSNSGRQVVLSSNLGLQKRNLFTN